MSNLGDNDMDLLNDEPNTFDTSPFQPEKPEPTPPPVLLTTALYDLTYAVIKLEQSMNELKKKLDI